VGAEGLVLALRDGCSHPVTDAHAQGLPAAALVESGCAQQPEGGEGWGRGGTARP